MLNARTVVGQPLDREGGSETDADSRSESGYCGYPDRASSSAGYSEDLDCTSSPGQGSDKRPRVKVVVL